MKHSYSSLHTARNTPWAESCHTYRHAPENAVSDDLLSSSADIHMRFVAELEEVYWQSHFSSQAYYVAGRSYDQYQPAFSLGWNNALKNPDACFDEFTSLLEAQWTAHSGSSLLPWREVQFAVKDAWMHARLQMKTLQLQEPAPLCGREVTGVLQPLYRSCLKTAGELEKLGVLQLSDFVKQIIERHVHLMQGFAGDLFALCAPSDELTFAVRPWVSKFQRKWSTLKLRLVEISPEDFLASCEQMERNLLSAYQSSLVKQLPQETKDVLQQHAKQLKKHVQKLSWVRKNLSIA